MEESVSDVFTQKMFNVCFRAVAPKDKVMTRIEQEYFANCCVRFVDAYKVVNQAVISGDKDSSNDRR